MVVLIRADGGRGHGFGHLVRSTALARELLLADESVVYSTRTPEAVSKFVPNGCTIEPLSSETEPFGTTEAEEVAKIAGKRAAKAVVVDSFEATTRYQSTLREDNWLCLVLDDTRHVLDCDLLINGNTYADQLTYDWLSSEPTWCLGPEYLLIRRDFRRRPSLDTPDGRQATPRVLVTMGGSDPTNATPMTLRALAGLNVAVDVIVGPAFENVDLIEYEASRLETNTTLHRNPNNLPDLMYRADIAVSATGTTTYELLAAGTAVVGMPRTENQELIAQDLDARGVILSLGLSVSEDDISGAVVRLIHDLPERHRLQTDGRTLIDGRGPSRLVDIINSGTAD